MYGKVPPPTLNSDLIGNKDFYHLYPNSLPESIFLNDVVNNDFSVNRDAKIIDQKLWNFFNQKYPGGTKIQRPVVYYKGEKIENIRL